MTWGSPGEWRRSIIILFSLSLSCFRAQFQTEQPDPNPDRPEPQVPGQKKGDPKVPLLAEDSPQPVEILRLTYVINIKLGIIRSVLHQQTDDLVVIMCQEIFLGILTIRLIIVEVGE